MNESILPCRGLPLGTAPWKRLKPAPSPGPGRNTGWSWRTTTPFPLPVRIFIRYLRQDPNLPISYNPHIPIGNGRDARAFGDIRLCSRFQRFLSLIDTGTPSVRIDPHRKRTAG